MLTATCVRQGTRRIATMLSAAALFGVLAGPLVALALLPSSVAVAANAKPPLPDVPEGKTRGDKALKGGPMPYWGDRPDQAEPLVATFIGGKGSEWLCAGGFQPDGTIVLAGNVSGGEFGLAVKESILGTDAAQPAPLKSDATVELSWTRPDTTGFLVFTTSDLKKITKVVRLPWISAAITSMVVADDGAIYLAGKPGAGIASLGGKQDALVIPAEVTRKSSLAEAAFIAKLSKDGDKVEWLYTAAGKTDAPQISISDDGKISFGAQDLRVFDPSGKQISSTVVPGGVRETTAVSPLDGTVVRGGEHNTGTGREPWRCPELKVYGPDGALRYQLYEWPPRYVGMDVSRQVSDTAVRGVSFDKDGNLLVKLWSDGGNSVATTQPTDIRRGPTNSGLGLNAAGAHATSFTYLAKIEPKNYQLIGWTMWCSKFAGKANGAGIDSLSYGDDGSVLFAGGSAWGLIQTGNKLANGEPGGQYIAVTNPDMTGIRFSSCVPGLGTAKLGNNNTIAIGHGSVNGKARALFLGGATADGDVYGLVTKTPTLNPLQAEFGGGASDGYVVMVDLAAGTPVVKAPTPPAAPIRLLIVNEGVKKPETATVTDFAFSATFPKWNHADAEIRVADGSYWPNFVAGNPDSGKVTVTDTGVTGSLTASFNIWAQSQGKQDRRVLGQLFTDGTPPKLSLTVNSFAAKVTETLSYTDNKGATKERPVEYQTLDAALTIGNITVKVPFKAIGKRGGVAESALQRLNITAYATVKGSLLGLKDDLAEKDIDIRINVQGIDAAKVPAPRAK